MNTESDRGQTTLDFAVGTSILLIALIAVFVVISGTLSPFTLGGQEDIVMTNRVATSLSEGLLGDPGNPHVLNATCTVYLFNESIPADVPPGCRYSGENLTERIGLKNWKRANLTLKSNLSAGGTDSNTLCWTGSDFEECSGSGERMQVGPPAPDSGGSSVTARRIVSIDGDDATLVVHIW
ncbi:MAG: hypothetical protein V5A18_00780 [Haloarculaceae archaeon]